MKSWPYSKRGGGTEKPQSLRNGCVCCPFGQPAHVESSRLQKIAELRGRNVAAVNNGQNNKNEVEKAKIKTKQNPQSPTVSVRR